MQPGKSTSVSRRGICERAIWRKPLARRTRWGYGIWLGDSKIVRLRKRKSKVVSEASFAFGQELRVSRRGLDIEIDGWSSAGSTDRDTKATGVNESVRGRGMRDRLGGVNANPLVYELGGVPGRKRFDSQHGGATLRTTEACWEMGKVGSGRRGLGMIQK